jgi:hypothetical protein
MWSYSIETNGGGLAKSLSAMTDFDHKASALEPICYDNSANGYQGA